MTVREPREAYTLLGLHPSASIDDINLAYHRCTLEYQAGPRDRDATLLMNSRTDAYQFVVQYVQGRNIYHPDEAAAGADADLVVRIVPVPGLTGPEAAPEEATVMAVPGRWSPWLPNHAVTPREAMLYLCLFWAWTAAALLFAGIGLGFLAVASGGDAAAVRAFDSAGSCGGVTVPGSQPNCRDTEPASVSDQSQSIEFPVIGGYADRATILVANTVQATNLGVSDGDELSTGSTVQVTLWHHDVVAVESNGLMLKTDATPSVIASRHMTIAWIWLVLALALAVGPVVRMTRSLILMLRANRADPARASAEMRR